MTDEWDDDAVELPIEDFLDLHPFQPRDIKEVVLAYLDEALRLGFTEVRIIHGRGIGVQREIVRGVLERHENVTSFTDAPSEPPKVEEPTLRDKVQAQYDEATKRRW